MFPSVLLDSASSTDWTQTINWTAVVLFAGAFLLASFAVLAFPLVLILVGRNGQQDPEPDADAPPESRTRPKAQEDMGDMAERARKASIAVKAAAKKQAEMEKLAAERKKAASKSAKKKTAGAPKKKAAAKAKKKAATKTAKAAKKKTTATKKNDSVPVGAKLDPDLGLVYKKKPKDVDDLKEISGVGPVLEGKLHKTGVYTFAQVAKWSDKMATEFGERLSFRDRIFRDDWRKQAAKLHKKKHGKSA